MRPHKHLQSRPMRSNKHARRRGSSRHSGPISRARWARTPSPARWCSSGPTWGASTSSPGKGESSESVLIVSDGRDLFTYLPALDQYIRSVPGPDGRNIHALVTGLVECFFRPDSMGVVPAGGRSAYLGKEMMDGTEYDIVEITGPAPQGSAIRYFVSPKDQTHPPGGGHGQGQGWRDGIAVGQTEEHPN